MNHRYEYTYDLITTIKSLLQESYSRRIFLVRGKHSFDTCGAAYMFDCIQKQCNIEIVSYAEFSVNPKIEEVEVGIEKIMRAQVDLIVAVGGGSVIDMAKLIRYYAANKGAYFPLWAVPTTAGTGAEATHFAVVYQQNIKCSIASKEIIPNIAIICPQLTYKNNKYLTACTGFDALAQAIEAYWNKNATEESDIFALRAAELIHQSLLSAINHDDVVSRDNLAKGAYWSGRAINITKTTAPHAFSYAFTTYCGYPHGHAVAITFPYFAKLNMLDSKKKDKLRKLLKINDGNDFQQYFIEYLDNIGLKYVGTKGKDLHQILSLVNIERLKNNPIKVTKQVINNLERFLKHQMI